MTLDLDDSTTAIGRIEIAVIIKDDGSLATSYGLEDLTLESALGYLTSVTDRVREEIKHTWDSCPECGRPWSEHDHGEFEEPETELDDDPEDFA